MHKAEFSISAASGIVAGAISAAGVLYAHRNPTTTHSGATNTLSQRLTMLRAQWRTLTGFPTAQEIALAAHYVSAFGSPSADYTGGTDLSNPASAPALRALGPDHGPIASTPFSVLQSGNVRIATTAALSHAGSPTIDTHPFARDSMWELAASATVQQGGFELVWTPSPEGAAAAKGLVLEPGTGFIITVPIALGATGTGRLFVESFFQEG